MRKILLYSLFVIFLTTNITKWYATVGSDVRVYYNHVAILLWMALAIPYLSSLRHRIPSEIKWLMLLRVLFIGAVLLGVPTLDSGFTTPVLITYAKAGIVALLEGSGLLLMLVFVTHLSATERRTVVNLYLAALTAHLCATLLQGWLIYQWNIDLDTWIAANLPLWNGSPASMDDEVFGLASGTYYRLSGFTGDPNLNGMIMLVGLPVLFFRAFERGSLVLIGLLVLLIGGLLLTVSNTVILLSLPVLALMILRYRKRSRWIKVGAGVAFAAIAIVLAVKYGAEIRETIAFKLDSSGSGTASSHVTLASEALGVWREHPLGVGANSYPRYSEEFSVHNSYLQSLVELGPLGLLLCVTWCATCLYLCWHARKGAGYATMVAVGALTFGALGHDMLNRYEFQLALNLLVAIAVLDHRDARRHEPPVSAPLPAPVPAGAA